MASQTLVFRARQLLDTVVYVGVVVTGVFIGAIVVSFIGGTGWLGVKYLLFSVGIMLFGIGTFMLQPTPPWKKERRFPALERAVLQSRLYRYPPLDAHGVAPDQRLSVGAKLFLAGVVLLAGSFLLETVFSVTP